MTGIFCYIELKWAIFFLMWNNWERNLQIYVAVNPVPIQEIIVVRYDEKQLPCYKYQKNPGITKQKTEM